MVALATGHQVHCILWVQGDTYNKGIGFCGFLWIKILCIEYILWRILTTKCMFHFVIMLKRLTVKDVPINNYDLLNIQACSFNVFWNTPSTQSVVVSSKYWVVPLKSTGVSGHCQGILCHLLLNYDYDITHYIHSINLHQSSQVKIEMCFVPCIWNTNHILNTTKNMIMVKCFKRVATQFCMKYIANWFSTQCTNHYKLNYALSRVGYH